jgi:hypothetical protein
MDASSEWKIFFSIDQRGFKAFHPSREAGEFLQADQLILGATVKKITYSFFRGEGHPHKWEEDYKRRLMSSALLV